MWANPAAYVRLPLLGNGGVGPWAELYDDEIQTNVLGIRPGSHRAMVVGPDAETPDDWEIYAGAPSPFEAHAENFARHYAER